MAVADPQAALAARAAALTAADVADATERRGVIAGLGMLAGNGTVAGWARTGRAVAGDADTVHAAVMDSRPGEMVVVDFGGPDVGLAGIGDLVAAEGRRRGLAGIVLWGPARDAVGLAEVGLPIFATGLTPAPGRHERMGELDVPIVIGGAEINPGDLVVGDADGVVVVPAAAAAEVVEHAERTGRTDRDLRDRVLAGEPLAELPELREYLSAIRPER